MYDKCPWQHFWVECCHKCIGACGTFETCVRGSTLMRCAVCSMLVLRATPRFSWKASPPTCDHKQPIAHKPQSSNRKETECRLKMNQRWRNPFGFCNVFDRQTPLALFVRALAAATQGGVGRWEDGCSPTQLHVPDLRSRITWNRCGQSQHVLISTVGRSHM